MANAARVLRFRRAPAVTDARLMRLVRFPAVRAAISGALSKAAPEKVHHVAGRPYVRFRMEDPSRFHPALFATIPVGSRGTLLVIGTPKAHIKKKAALAAFLKRMGPGLRTEARRSLVYQLRRAGIVGGSRTQAVLVPRERVLSVAAQYARSSAGRVAANPILATLGFNPGKRVKLKERRVPSICDFCGQRRTLKQRMDLPGVRVFETGGYRAPWVCARCGGKRNNPLTRWEAAQILKQGKADLQSKDQLRDPLHRGLTAGRVQGRAADVMEFGPSRAKGAAVKVYDRARDHAYGPKRRSVSRNPAQGGVTRIDVPFRAGQKISPAQMRKWIDSLPAGAVKANIKRRFEQAMRQYKRFHFVEPKFFTYKPVPMGSAKQITDVDMVVSEGKEWAAPYQVPRHSGKYEAHTEGRYVHAHGDSKMKIDIKRPVGAKRLPERFHTADGKFVGVIPSKNVTIRDWYRG